jgi:phytoene synthase
MSETSAERIASDDAACLAQLREQDRDAYYALLFMPARHRPALAALHAFAAELATIRSRVSEPLPGEVRIQWWRDVLAGTGERGGEGHPVAAGLMRAIREHSLPVAALDAMAEAMIDELYDDPWPDVTAMEARFGAVDSALMRLCALVLAERGEAGPADAPGHAGVALGITRLLRRFGQRSARGQAVLPADVMARHGVTHEALMAGRAEPGLKPALAEMVALARAHLRKARGFVSASPATVRPAFLQAALCEGYLRQIDAAGHDPFRDRVERAPFAALWTLWRGGVPLG